MPLRSMRNEGAATAKMKHIKQNERQDCGAKIYLTFLISIFSENTVHAYSWSWKRMPLPGQEASSGMQVSSNTVKVSDLNKSVHEETFVKGQRQRMKTDVLHLF